MDNDDLFKAFVQTCDKVKDTLKNKYGDQWTDPQEGAPQKCRKMMNEMLVKLVAHIV